MRATSGIRVAAVSAAPRRPRVRAVRRNGLGRLASALMVDGELLDTPHGPARVFRRPADEGADAAKRRSANGASAEATLLLGHGAGGSVEAPDIQAVTSAATAAGIDVVLVEQPYRVAGKRSAAPAPKLDEAWASVVEQLGLAGSTVPFFAGGRSSGARVACRTAKATGAAGVVCLAFPLITPKGASRQDELDAAGVPVFIAQGESDRFGMPEPGEGREVVRVRGDHGLKRDLDVVSAAVVAWIQRQLPAG